MPEAFATIHSAHQAGPPAGPDQQIKTAVNLLRGVDPRNAGVYGMLGTNEGRTQRGAQILGRFGIDMNAPDAEAKLAVLESQITTNPAAAKQVAEVTAQTLGKQGWRMPTPATIGTEGPGWRMPTSATIGAEPHAGILSARTSSYEPSFPILDIYRAPLAIGAAFTPHHSAAPHPAAHGVHGGHTPVNIA